MPIDQLSATFAALADPTRRAILAKLVSGACSVTALAEPFDMSMPAVSKHLGVLERAGLIARGREAQWRPCRIEPGPLKAVSDWTEHYRHLWEQRLGRLETYLQQLQTEGASAGQAPPERSRGRRTPPTSASSTSRRPAAPAPRRPAALKDRTASPETRPPHRSTNAHPQTKEKTHGRKSRGK